MSDDQAMSDSSQDAMDLDASSPPDGEITFSLGTPATILMQIGLRGLWVNPAIPKDKCAEQMLEVLRPLLQHTIDTEVERLTKKRDDAAKAERARCIRAIQRMPVPIEQVDGATRAIAAIEALEPEDTP